MDSSLSPDLISALFAQVSNTGEMSECDCQMLQAAILSNAVTEEEKQAIDRLLYAIRLGRVHVIAERHV